MNKNQSSIPDLYHRNITITDNEAKPQVLNEFFLSQTFVDDSTFSLPSDVQIDVNFIQLSLLMRSKFENILESLDPCKANGPDGNKYTCA